MRVLVSVNLPDLPSNLSPEDRGALRWAGVSMRMLRTSWGATLTSVLRRTYPEDRWEVTVRSHPCGPPRFETTKHVQLASTPTVTLVTETAAWAWLGAIGHITMLRMAARQRGKVQA